jgi:chitinase
MFSSKSTSDKHQLTKPQVLDRAAGCDRHFYLTIACPAGACYTFSRDANQTNTIPGASNYTKLRFQEMTPVLDFYNLMAYDYAGSWDTNSGHLANLVPSTSNPPSTPFSTDAALNHYINVGGVPPCKIVLGMPLYGRAFTNTDGPGAPFSGVGEGSWENGVWDYKALPRPGAQERFDAEAGASYCYDGEKRTMVSYDSPRMASVKANYIRQRGLGGGMWWESSGDKGGKGANAAEGSLIGIFVDGVGGVGGLDQSPNALSFPESKYDNVKTGFPKQ